MAEPSWLIYANGVAGLVGCATGITGACLGFLAYRRSVKYKALDLRLQLQKAEGDARAQLVELQALIGRVRKSRTAALAAVGSRPGALEEWRSTVARDLSKVVELEETVSRLPTQYVGLSHEALLARLITVHEAQAVITALSGKYYALPSADASERELVRADPPDGLELRTPATVTEPETASVAAARRTKSPRPRRR